MPIFEYECDACGIVMEQMVVGKEVPKVEYCEVCMFPLRRIMSATNFKLNGSCWARDGYASNGTYYGDPEGQGRDE